MSRENPIIKQEGNIRDRKFEMRCFLCASKSSSATTDDIKSDAEHERTPLSDASKVTPPKYVEEKSKVVSHTAGWDGAREPNGTFSPRPSLDPARFKARKFAFSEMVAATGNFRKDFFLGAGGFGKVYKGYLRPSGEKVAIKRFVRSGNQGIREFVVEVLTLSNAQHDNLVKLIGYCAEAEHRLLVYEYMPLGSLEDHLHGHRANRRSLDWNTRMNIAACAAKGLDYLHNRMKPPVIYRDLKCANILLGKEYLPKLSDFGLAKVGPSGDQSHVSTRVMGTYGYCAPDYLMTGQLTFKSDIYSFGVVLLEIITGRRAIDDRTTGPTKNIVEWARPMFKDRRKFHQMADPALGGRYPSRALYQVLAIAAMCTEKDADMRPEIGDIVKALTYLSSQMDDPIQNMLPVPNGTELNVLSSNSVG